MNKSPVRKISHALDSEWFVEKANDQSINSNTRAREKKRQLGPEKWIILALKACLMKSRFNAFSKFSARKISSISFFSSLSDPSHGTFLPCLGHNNGGKPEHGDSK